MEILTDGIVAFRDFVEECAERRIAVSETPEYYTWINMRQRCYNPRRTEFPRYGGRGIYVDPKFSSFVAFFEEVGRKPSKRYSLDRFDSRRGYEPGNIGWRTLEEQALNQRDRVLFTFRGKFRSIRGIARDLNVPYATVRYWLNVARHHVSEVEKLAERRALKVI